MGSSAEGEARAGPSRRPFEASMYDAIGQGIYVFSRGVLDACCLQRCIPFFLHSSIIRIRSLQCFLLNGVLFIGSLLVFDRLIVPCLETNIGKALRGVLWKGAGFATQESIPSSSGGQVTSETLWLLFFLRWGYILFWLVPIYCLSFVLNSLWYQDIAEQAFLLSREQEAKARSDRKGEAKGSYGTDAAPEEEPQGAGGGLDRVVSEMYRCLLNGVWLIQTHLVLELPVVGRLLYVLHWAWLVALYCFEYRWSYVGWSVAERSRYFEKHWLYFAGFGLPATLLCVRCPAFVDSGVFALIFPVCLLVGTCATPLRYPHPSLERLHLFVGVELVTWGVLRLITSSKRGASNEVGEGSAQHRNVQHRLESLFPEDRTKASSAKEKRTL